MAAAKDLTIEELFTKDVERYHVDARGQLNLLTAAPDVQTTVASITAFYAPKMGCVRLFVGGKEGGWRYAQSLPEPSRYEAIRLALDDYTDAVAALGGYDTKEHAVAAWRGNSDARRMQRMGEEFDDREDAANGEGQ